MRMAGEGLFPENVRKKSNGWHWGNQFPISTCGNLPAAQWSKQLRTCSERRKQELRSHVAIVEIGWVFAPHAKHALRVVVLLCLCGGRPRGLPLVADIDATTTWS